MSRMSPTNASVRNASTGARGGEGECDDVPRVPSAEHHEQTGRQSISTGRVCQMHKSDQQEQAYWRRFEDVDTEGRVRSYEPEVLQRHRFFRADQADAQRQPVHRRQASRRGGHEEPSNNRPRLVWFMPMIKQGQQQQQR